MTILNRKSNTFFIAGGGGRSTSYVIPDLRRAYERGLIDSRTITLQESTRYPFTEQDLVYSILHRFSNYDNVVWSLYASNDSQFILSQLKQALIEISYIDSSLTWACMEIMERYKSQLKIRQKKSSYIINPSLNLN